MSYLLYKHEGMCSCHDAPALEKGYSYRFWTPRAFHLLPTGFKLFPFAIWGLMHHLRLFSSREYAVFIILGKNGKIAHRSIITPRYFRFPFMGENDVQIGDVWTGYEDRGKGLATFALKKIIAICSRPGRKIWYVADSNNVPSVRLAGNAGFALYGEGVRTKWMGVKALGAYEISKS